MERRKHAFSSRTSWLHDVESAADFLQALGSSDNVGGSQAKRTRRCGEQSRAKATSALSCSTCEECGGQTVDAAAHNLVTGRAACQRKSKVFPVKCVGQLMATATAKLAARIRVDATILSGNTQCQKHSNTGTAPSFESPAMSQDAAAVKCARSPGLGFIRADVLKYFFTSVSEGVTYFQKACNIELKLREEDTILNVVPSSSANGHARELVFDIIPLAEKQSRATAARCLQQLAASLECRWRRDQHAAAAFPLKVGAHKLHESSEGIAMNHAEIASGQGLVPFKSAMPEVDSANGSLKCRPTVLAQWLIHAHKVVVRNRKTNEGACSTFELVGAQAGLSVGAQRDAKLRTCLGICVPARDMFLFVGSRVHFQTGDRRALGFVCSVLTMGNRAAVIVYADGQGYRGSVQAISLQEVSRFEDHPTNICDTVRNALALTRRFLETLRKQLEKANRQPPYRGASERAPPPNFEIGKNK